MRRVAAHRTLSPAQACRPVARIAHVAHVGCADCATPVSRMGCARWGSLSGSLARTKSTVSTPSAVVQARGSASSARSSESAVSPLSAVVQARGRRRGMGSAVWNVLNLPLLRAGRRRYLSTPAKPARTNGAAHRAPRMPRRDGDFAQRRLPRRRRFDAPGQAGARGPVTRGLRTRVTLADRFAVLVCRRRPVLRRHLTGASAR